MGHAVEELRFLTTCSWHCEVALIGLAGLVLAIVGLYLGA